MTTQLPPDDFETRVISTPPAGAPPTPPGAPEDYEPGPSRGLGWGMLLGALLLIAIAAGVAAVYFATRDDGSNSAATTTAPPVTQPATTAPAAPVAAARVFVPDVKGLKQDKA